MSACSYVLLHYSKQIHLIDVRRPVSSASGVDLRATWGCWASARCYVFVSQACVSSQRSAALQIRSQPMGYSSPRIPFQINSEKEPDLLTDWRRRNKHN